MEQLSRIIEKALKKYLGPSIKDLSTRLVQSLDNRLTENISIKSSFKDAKKDFMKRYFREILTLCHGNVSKAANIAGLNRRHIHRILKELEIKPESFRKEMIKPYIYLTENVADVVERKVEEFKSRIQPNKLDMLYSDIPEISKRLTSAINMQIPSYDDAFSMFEKQYFETVLSNNNYDIEKASEAANLSKRSMFRKIKLLEISV